MERNTHPQASAVHAALHRFAPGGGCDLLGTHPLMLAMFERIARCAPERFPVLILGERGTGKRSVAAALHALGPRAALPFVTISVGALPESLAESELFGHEKGAFTGAIRTAIGRFELAGKGSAFLDEIGDMPPALQMKVLRILQEREFERLGSGRTRHAEARIISATNHDMDGLVREGGFRPDLYDRLNVLRIVVPPLRDRVEDIELLARHFLRLARPDAPRTLSAGALRVLGRYPWPGNVRELENVLYRATVESDGPVIEGDAVARILPKIPAAEESGRGRRITREVLLRMLLETEGNVREAARRLGVCRTTIYSRIRKYGLRHADRDDSGIWSGGTPELTD